jgi:phosphatidylglycerol---prolipoprotein diacylglyceryl transferase
MYCALEDRSALFQFGGISSFGGIFAGALALASCVHSLGGLADQRWRWFDAASYSAVFSALIARVGCFLAHDHLGVRTSAWISVKYNDGSRYNLALLEVIFLALLALVLIVGSRHSWLRFDGSTFGVTAFSYAWFRFSLDYLQEVPRRYYGLTAEQYGALVLVGMSFGGFWAAKTRRSNFESKENKQTKLVGATESSIGGFLT